MDSECAVLVLFGSAVGAVCGPYHQSNHLFDLLLRPIAAGSRTEFGETGSVIYHLAVRGGSKSHDVEIISGGQICTQTSSKNHVKSTSKIDEQY